jgi:hypothetical protein
VLDGSLDSIFELVPVEASEVSEIEHQTLSVYPKMENYSNLA